MSNFYQLLSNVPENEPEPDENDQQEVQQQEESNDADYSFLDVLPDGWKPQQKFATSQEELQFYREKYPGLWKHINSDEFISSFVDHYGNKILSKESQVKNALALMKGLQNDPETFIASHLPEYAERLGIGRIYNEDEIGEYIEAKIAEEFGENWREIFNQADLVRPKSISSQIMKRTRAYEDAIDQHNQKVQTNREKYLEQLANQQQQPVPGQMTEKQLDNILDIMVDGYISELAGSGLTEEEFIEMAVQSFTHQPTVKDIYRIMHYDKIIEHERKQAFEEGRKAMLNEYKRSSKKAAMEYVPSDNFDEQQPRPRSFMGMRL